MTTSLLRATRPARRTTAAALLVGTTLAALLAGCSSNKGGDTTCGDFLSQDNAAQTETVTAYLESEGSSTSGANVNLTRLGAQAYCNTIGDSSSPISDMKNGAAEFMDSFEN